MERLPEVAVRRIVADLTVAQTDPSAQFYRDLFELEVAMDLGWVATLTPSGRSRPQLTLLTDDATAALNPQVSIEVDNLDIVWRRALDIGAEVVHERTIEPWGVERFFLRDPSGNVINVLSHGDARPTGT